VFPPPGIGAQQLPECPALGCFGIAQTSQMLQAHAKSRKQQNRNDEEQSCRSSRQSRDENSGKGIASGQSQADDFAKMPFVDVDQAIFNHIFLDQMDELLIIGSKFCCSTLVQGISANLGCR